jgi:hypothetical protein
MTGGRDQVAQVNSTISGVEGGKALKGRIISEVGLGAEVRALRGLLDEALGYEADAFGGNVPVDGGDLVEWFGEWRERVRATLRPVPRGCEHAGYVVYTNEAIWGYGGTTDAAWESFRAEMATGGVKILTGDDSDAEQGSWTRERDYSIRSASAALLRRVAEGGGDTSWTIVGGVACTEAEAEEFTPRGWDQVEG